MARNVMSGGLFRILFLILIVAAINLSAASAEDDWVGKKVMPKVSAKFFADDGKEMPVWKIGTFIVSVLRRI